MCAQGENIYTAAFDGKVKKWVGIDTEPKIVDEFPSGKCVNAMVNGPNNTLYIGNADGQIQQITF